MQHETHAFHVFPLLPSELRIQIWQEAVTPRFVEVRARPKRAAPDAITHILTRTPAPSLLHACHESRAVLTEGGDSHGGGCGRRARYRRAFSHGSTPRYTWVNFEVDSVSFGSDTWDFLRFGSDDLGRMVRMRFIGSPKTHHPSTGAVRAVQPRWTTRAGGFDYPGLCRRPRRTDIETIIVCRDGIAKWEAEWASRHFWGLSCTRRVFVDGATGLVLDAREVGEVLHFKYFTSFDNKPVGDMSFDFRIRRFAQGYLGAYMGWAAALVFKNGDTQTLLNKARVKDFGVG